MSEKPIDEEIKLKAQKARKTARYMYSTRDMVEDQIRKAMDRGDFDNLEGAGKPLHFEEKPYEPPEMRMVNKILKDNDFAPYWIELGKEIDREFEQLKEETEQFKKYTGMIYSNRRSKTALQRYTSKKEYFYAESRAKLEKIDKKILDYNLHCPTFRMGRSNISIDDEMFKIITSIELLIEELLESE